MLYIWVCKVWVNSLRIVLTLCYVDIPSDTECRLNSIYRRYVHIGVDGVDFNTVMKDTDYYGIGTRAPRSTSIRRCRQISVRFISEFLSDRASHSGQNEKAHYNCSMLHIRRGRQKATQSNNISPQTCRRRRVN